MTATPPRLFVAVAFLLAGCATGDPARTERTVFDNPYAAPVIAETGIGPQCEVARGQDATCLGVPLTRRGRGTVVGDRVSHDLDRNQRRILRERAEQLEQVSEQIRTSPSPSPPPPQAPAAGADDTT